jgi:hypothetical protein
VIERTLAKEKFFDFLQSRVTGLLTDVRNELDPDQSDSPPFLM